MRGTRVAFTIVALAALLAGWTAYAAKGGKKPKPPPPPPGEPEIACRWEGGKGKDKGIWLSVYDLNGNRTEVTKTSLWRCSWSPDGQHIAWGRGTSTEISRVDVDGTDRILLYAGDWAIDPAWSPDGETIAFANDDVTRGLSMLSLVPAEGGTPQAIHTVDYETWIIGPTWNAAGTHIAFLESVDGDNPMKVRVIEVATGVVTDVATINTGFNTLEWARTQGVLLYAHAGKVYTLDMGTGQSTEVASGSCASWSPDDSEIVVERNSTLFRHVLATGAETEIGGGRFPNWKR